MTRVTVAMDGDSQAIMDDEKRPLAEDPRPGAEQTQEAQICPSDHLFNPVQRRQHGMPELHIPRVG